MRGYSTLVCALILSLGPALMWPIAASGQFRANERLNRQRGLYQDQVALIHGDDGPTNRLLWLPNGEIVTVARTEVQPTERRFVPLTGEQMLQSLRQEPALAKMNATVTNHYVFVHNTSEPFATATRRIMESMIPGIVVHIRAMKVPVHPPPTPLVVVMFRTERQYQAYQKIPPGVVAYYEPIRNRVVMCEEVKGSVSQRLAFQQQISTIAHEGVHQILHNIGVQQRLSAWPAWLNEGLAEYFAPTTFGKRLTWKGAGQVNDWRMYELERFLKSGADAGELVGDTVIAHRLTSTGYATAWGLTHFLSKHERDGFHEMIREYSQLGPLEGAEDVARGIAPSQRATFAQHIGGDFAALERRIVKHLRTLPYQDPFAMEPHFAAFAQSPQGREADIFHTRGDAQRWCDRKAMTGVETVVRQFRTRAEAEAYASRWLK